MRLPPYDRLLSACLRWFWLRELLSNVQIPNTPRQRRRVDSSRAPLTTADKVPWRYCNRRTGRSSSMKQQPTVSALPTCEVRGTKLSIDASGGQPNVISMIPVAASSYLPRSTASKLRTIACSHHRSYSNDLGRFLAPCPRQGQLALLPRASTACPLISVCPSVTFGVLCSSRLSDCQDVHHRPVYLQQGSCEACEGSPVQYLGP